MAESSTYSVRPGRAKPLGATILGEGVQFALFSRNATQVWLALFGEGSQVPSTPIAEFALEPSSYRNGDVWSAFVEGAKAGTRYMYRVDGPSKKERGHYFDPGIFLLDPYGKAISGSVSDGTARSLVVADDFDWNGTRPLRTPMRDTIIYEVHVKGFTAHPSSNTQNPGTYRSFIEKIPHLKELGVTAVEFLPVHHSGERVIKLRQDPDTKEPLINYWGYQPIGFFAPDGYYAADGGDGGQISEFRELVRALHEAGMEIILDVVYNHTAEYSETRHTMSFRGIDNTIYYHVGRGGKYKDFTGCGNSLNCNHPIVRDLILESMHYWVNDMHVDGFRFDLATVLNRNREGDLLANAPLVEHISEAPIMRDVKLIAEPWDIAGGYQVGAFGGRDWAEWNDHFRDDVRRFWRGDQGVKGAFASRLTGSPDLYQASGRTPHASINFVSAHDGFTLRDLVSYNHKHNRKNGEENRDGNDHNLSCNCGEEGVSEDPLVLMLRERMQRNYLATLFLSLGVPMLLGGDEFSRTQEGNNNAYCQDNELSWFNWEFLEQNRPLFEYCKAAIAFRKANPVFSRPTFFTGAAPKGRAMPDILWFTSEGEAQDWNEADTTLACRIDSEENQGTALYLMFNPSGESRTFTLPEGEWRLRINTARAMPDAIPEKGESPVVDSGAITVGQRALVVLAQTAK